MARPLAAFSFRLSIAPLTFTAGLGCSDGLGPSGFVGSYALERVGRDALPAVVYVSEDVTIRILADTLLPADR